MDSQPLVNPYDPLDAGDGILPPFAGRQKAFEHLYQGLTDPERTHTPLILGREGSGKTALLQQFNSFFDETFIGVYLPLQHMALTEERDWINGLVKATEKTLAERNYTMSRLPELDGVGANIREWFVGSYLPELMSLLRRHRRIVYLLDDAETLLQAIESGKLEDDTIRFLNTLIEQFGSLGLVLTLDTRYEADISKLSPLVEVENVYRLANLSAADTAWVLNEGVGGRYRLNDAAVAAVQAATGGQPRLIQRFGFHLIHLWKKQPEHIEITPADIKQVTSQVYNQSETELRTTWTETTRNERLVLTAISSLLYADPLTTTNPGSIETWLVETDYPLDSTAIHAAIRGLEYREIVENTPNGVRLTSGLMQTWLLENARLTETVPQTPSRPRIQWIALILVAVIVVALVLAASQGRSAPQTDETPQPTVTLVTTPGE